MTSVTKSPLCAKNSAFHKWEAFQGRSVVALLQSPVADSYFRSNYPFVPDLLSSRGKIATATIVLTRLRLPVSKTSFAVCPLLCPMNRYYPKMVSITAQSFWHFCGKPSQKFSRRKTPLCARSQTFKLRSEILFPAFYLLLDEIGRASCRERV